MGAAVSRSEDWREGRHAEPPATERGGRQSFLSLARPLGLRFLASEAKKKFAGEKWLWSLLGQGLGASTLMRNSVGAGTGQTTADVTVRKTSPLLKE